MLFKYFEEKHISSPEIAINCTAITIANPITIGLANFFVFYFKHNWK